MYLLAFFQKCNNPLLKKMDYSISFMVTLVINAIIQHQHVDALLAASSEVMDLLAALPKDVIALSTMTDGTDYPDMHNT